MPGSQEGSEGRAEARGPRLAPLAAVAASALAGCAIGGVCWGQLAFAGIAAFATCKGCGKASRWALASWACLAGLVVLWSMRCATALLAMSA